MYRYLIFVISLAYNIFGVNEIVDTIISGMDTTLTFTRYYYNNQIKNISQYTNWRLDGKQCEYYESGKIKKVSYYKLDCPQDSVVEWFENGKVSLIGYYNDCKENGLTIKYSEQGDTLSLLGYVKGLPVGSHFTKYRNGQIAYNCNYNTNGKKHGLCETWREDGTRKDSTVYRNDTIVEEREYFTSGKVRQWFKNCQNAHFDEAYFYHPNGKSAGKVLKGNGIVTGYTETADRKFTDRYENGKLVESREIKK
jgi:antitoxin component YwqK of YwqJK toxin-antitoxin module